MCVFFGLFVLREEGVLFSKIKTLCVYVEPENH